MRLNQSQSASESTVCSGVRRRFLSGWKSSSFSGTAIKAWNFWDKREARDCFLDRVSSGERPKHSKVINSRWTTPMLITNWSNPLIPPLLQWAPTLSYYCRRCWGWLFKGWHTQVYNSRLVYCSWSADVGSAVTDTLARGAGTIQLLRVSKTLICLALLHRGILQLPLHHTEKDGQISNRLFDIC